MLGGGGKGRKLTGAGLDGQGYGAGGGGGCVLNGGTAKDGGARQSSLNKRVA